VERLGVSAAKRTFQAHVSSGRVIAWEVGQAGMAGTTEGGFS
jgi:hypothetical protein